MAFFYVDENIGTGGTEYATQKTGTFSSIGAANIYVDIETAIAGGASDDDIICCSNVHDLLSATELSYTGGTSKQLAIMSVDDSNCENYSKGAKETTNSFGVDIKLQNLITIIGLSVISEDWIIISFSGDEITLIDAEMKLTVSGNKIELVGDGGVLILENSVLDLNQDGNYLEIKGGSTVKLISSVVKHTADTNGNYLTYIGFTAGGGSLIAIGTDLSSIDGTLIYNAGTSLNDDDYINIQIDKCTLHADVTFNDETLKSPKHNIKITQSSHNSAAAEYQYYFSTRGGTVEQATNIWRDESEPYYLSDQKVSLHAITNSDAEVVDPFIFDFPTRKAALSGVASTDVVRIYLCTDDAVTLYDDDVWAELIYPDGTNNNVFNMVNSLATPANIPSNPFRTPAVLPTDTGSTWKDSGGDLTGYNEYYIDLDTSADVGEDCVPKIRMHIALTLASGIYFDTSLGVVSS